MLAMVKANFSGKVRLRMFQISVLIVSLFQKMFQTKRHYETKISQ